MTVKEHLIDKTTHSRAGGQHEENMREEQEVSLVLLLRRHMDEHFMNKKPTRHQNIFSFELCFKK